MARISSKYTYRHTHTRTHLNNRFLYNIKTISLTYTRIHNCNCIHCCLTLIHTSIHTFNTPSLLCPVIIVFVIIYGEIYSENDNSQALYLKKAARWAEFFNSLKKKFIKFRINLIFLHLAAFNYYNTQILVIFINKFII